LGDFLEHGVDVKHATAISPRCHTCVAVASRRAGFTSGIIAFSVTATGKAQGSTLTCAPTSSATMSRFGCRRRLPLGRGEKREQLLGIVSPMRSASAAAAVLAVTVVIASGCGGGTSEGSAREARHIHGLGINPADKALFVATHSGMFRLPKGGSRLQPVGVRLQDTMGFTIVGPDHFLGSGHPDFYKDRDLPPLLGLVESRDAGRTWSPRSMLGRADLHVLRARGRFVVGYDVSKERILVSRDGGRSWRARPFTRVLVDLVVDPADPSRLLATSSAHLLLSRDDGRSWRSITETTGLLAWPERDQLYLLASDGRLWWSPDRGRRWKARGQIGGRPAAFSASSTGRVIAATEGGVIKQSRDGGRSWSERARLADAQHS
jgi:hypothetical protein